jgi:hypothetical protein
MRAEITMIYEDNNTAAAVAKAVSPDNLNAPEGLRVETVATQSSVISVIQCDKKIETFIATIDDLLSAIQSAEKTLAEIDS